jgi:predicted DNA-binding transcriptional regulator AlpA
MSELPERIVDQNEADDRTATDRATRRRMEARGLFPKRFEITRNGATGYLESEIAAWIAERAADRTPTARTAAAIAALRQKRRAKQAELRDARLTKEAAGQIKTRKSGGSRLIETPPPAPGA